MVGIQARFVGGLEPFAEFDVEDLEAQAAGGLTFRQSLRDRHPVAAQLHRLPTALGGLLRNRSRIGNRGFYKGDPAKRGKLEECGTGEAGFRNRWLAAEKSRRLDHAPILPPDSRRPLTIGRKICEYSFKGSRFDNDFSANLGDEIIVAQSFAVPVILR